MPREIQESRRSYILRRAEELALTRAFANCHAIEVVLRAEGYIEARETLERSHKREWLNLHCLQ
jgi:hypothetical protein